MNGRKNFEPKREGVNKKKLDLLGDIREGMLYNYTYMYFELIF